MDNRLRLPLGLKTGDGGWFLLLWLSLPLALLACNGQPAPFSTPVTLEGGPTVPPTSPAPDIPAVDLTLTAQDVTVAPLPLRAGVPFTLTVVLHNRSPLPAANVPVLVYISAIQEQIGFTPFLQVFTVTLPATGSVPLIVPVHWNFAGGKHQLWVQANRLPDAWRSRTPAQPEVNAEDNAVRLELMIDPFDAYTSDLCPGRVDVEIGPADLLLEPDARRVWVRVHNGGNQAVYNLPVVVIGTQVTGIAYTPAIPPCGGTAQVAVYLDHSPQQDELLSVQVNPVEWSGALPEDDFSNNSMTMAAGLALDMALPPDSGLDEYDFSLAPTDIELPEPWIALVTVHNLGTRDAAMVPIRIENEAGRKITDAIPLVRGNGQGVAAIRIGYLWTRGGTLTFTVNPAEVKGAYPEANRDNNVATFTLP